VDEFVYCFREVFDELIGNCVRAKRLALWGPCGRSVVVAPCDICVEGCGWVWCNVVGW
jgi:hypothetical protein